jgi:hypothetical protein
LRCCGKPFASRWKIELWDRIPGTRDDGTIDGEAQKAWNKKARTLAKEHLLTPGLAAQA